MRITTENKLKDILNNFGILKTILILGVGVILFIIFFFIFVIGFILSYVQILQSI